MNNVHGTAVVVGAHGILIRGASGAGKTTLGLELMRRARAAGLFSALISDDQIIMAVESGRLVAAAPPRIAGLVEVHGLGPVTIPSIRAAIVDVALILSPGPDVPRYQEPASGVWEGVALPELTLGQRDTARSAAVAFAHLGLDPFAGMRQNG